MESLMGSPIGTPTIADTSGGGGWLSGLVGVFSTIGTTFTNVYRTVNPPKPTTVPPGGAVYDPSSGQYRPAVAQPTTISPNTLLWAGVLIVLAVVLVPRLR